MSFPKDSCGRDSKNFLLQRQNLLSPHMFHTRPFWLNGASWVFSRPEIGTFSPSHGNICFAWFVSVRGREKTNKFKLALCCLFSFSFINKMLKASGNGCIWKALTCFSEMEKGAGILSLLSSNVERAAAEARGLKLSLPGEEPANDLGP